MLIIGSGSLKSKTKQFRSVVWKPKPKSNDVEVFLIVLSYNGDMPINIFFKLIRTGICYEPYDIREWVLQNCN